MKKTIKGFKQNASAALSALIVPVKNQIGANVSEFWQELEDVNRSPYGAAAGFTGFIYYSETVAFWRTHRSKIVDLMNEQAEEYGEPNALAMVCNFNGLKDYDTDEIARALYGHYNEKLISIYNVFAWYALEEVAHAYDSYKELN